MILTVTLNTSIDKLYLFDSYTPYEVMRVKQVNNTAGGKGLNVTRIATQLGEKVTAMGFVGGFVGQYFESLITQPTIVKAFTHTKAETRSCINAWDLQTNSSTEYLEPGAPVTAEEVEQFFIDFARELPNATVVTISGSVPTGVPADAYARLIAMCHEANKPVLMDTSGALLSACVVEKPTFIKPNTDEIAQLLGKKIENREELIVCAKQLHANGIATVVISLGAEGALMVCDEGVFVGRPPKINPKNTVGCGDSMVGGFAVGMTRGLRAPEQLRLAVAVSAANALSMSTGGYEEHDFETILPKVIVETVE